MVYAEVYLMQLNITILKFQFNKFKMLALQPINNRNRIFHINISFDVKGIDL